MKLVNNWHTLDILPLSADKLQVAQQQLYELKQEKKPPDSVVKQIIKLSEKQSKTAWVVLEQCNRWQRQTTAQNQITAIAKLKKNTRDLEQVAQQILKLAPNLQNSAAALGCDKNIVLNSCLIFPGWE